MVSVHFAGRRMSGEHDGAGMERRGILACAAVCTSPGGFPVWNGSGVM